MTTSEVKALLWQYGVELRQKVCATCADRGNASRCAKCQEERKMAALRVATDTLSLLGSKQNLGKGARHA